MYFIGDSITRRWGTSDAQYQDLLANWNANFKGWNAANFGWGADKTQHMLWRLQNGELDGVNPKVVVLMAGTNNIGNATPLGDVEARAADVARGVAALVREVRKRAPGATLIITGITPRNDNLDVMPVVNAANGKIAALADGKSIRYININEQLAFPDDHLRDGMAHDGLHLTPAAYQHWANALKPMLTGTAGTAGRESITRRRRPEIPAPRGVSEIRDHIPPKSGRPGAVNGAR